VKIPPFDKAQGGPAAGPDPKRFTKRYDWLMANAKAKQKWTDWRCRKMTEIYEWVKQRLKATRPDLQLVLYCNAGSYVHRGADEELSLPPLDYARRGGFDMERLLKDKDIAVLVDACMGNGVIGAWMNGKNTMESRYRAHHGTLYPAVCGIAGNGITLRYGWNEPDALAPESWIWTLSDAESWMHPSAEYFADYWVNMFVRSNPTLMMNAIQDISMWTSRETDMSRFAKAFRSLPAGSYTRLAGNGRDKNVWIQTCAWSNDVYGYIANPQWWELDAQVEFAAGIKAFDLIENKPIGDTPWNVRLAPYTVHPFRLTGAVGKNGVVACRAEVSRRGRELTTNRVAQAEKRVAEQRDLLRRNGIDKKADAVIAAAKSALVAEDFSAAYDLIAYYPYESLWTRKIRKARPGAYVRKQQVAGKRTRGITIDGSLSEWAGVPAAALDAAEQVFPASEKLEEIWTGAADLSATARVLWDDDNIYIAIQVADDVFGPHPSAMHKGDSVEVYFDTELAKDLVEHRYSEDDSHLKLAPPADQKGGLRVVLKQRSRGNRHAELPLDEVKSAWQKTANGYQVEVSVPWKLIRREPVAEGLEIGFDILLNDSDGKGQFKQWMFWSSNKTTCFKDPTSFGRLVLGK